MRRKRLLSPCLRPSTQERLFQGRKTRTLDQAAIASLNRPFNRQFAQTRKTVSLAIRRKGVKVHTHYALGPTMEGASWSAAIGARNTIPIAFAADLTGLPERSPNHIATRVTEKKVRIVVEIGRIYRHESRHSKCHWIEG